MRWARLGQAPWARGWQYGKGMVLGALPKK